MRRLRAALFALLMFGSGFCFSLYGVVLRRLAPSRLAALGQAWARFVLACLRLCCGVTYRAEGLENLPADGAVIAAQHQSELDIFLLLACLSRPVFVLKYELTRIPLFGPLLAPAGMIPVNRAGGAAALRQMVAAARQAVGQGVQVVIFPEGTRVAPGQRGALQGGIVALARAAGAPVVPVACATGHLWGRKLLDKDAGEAVLQFEPPLPAGLDREAMHAALMKVFHEGQQPLF